MKRHSFDRLPAFLPTAIICLLTLSAFAQKNSLLGKTNFAAYLEEAPALPVGLHEAGRRAYGENILQPDYAALERFYQPFFTKIESKVNEHQRFYGDKLQAFNEREGEDGLRRRAIEQSNSNPIVRDMGGVEAISQMSEAEAEAAARRAAANYMANPMAASGVQSPGMQALYQKMMSDPAYAQRFQKMSEKEREAELRRFMANDPEMVKTPQEMEAYHREHERQMRQATEVRNAMAIQQFMADLQQRIHAADQKFGEDLAALQNVKGNHNEIAADYERRYEAIPMVVLGEYGRDHDPEQVKQLQLETAEKHRAFAERLLKQQAPLLADLRAQYKQIAAAYLDFIGENGHKVNTALEDIYTGTNTEIALAEFEMGLLGLAGRIADRSKDLTQAAAQWEHQYRETLRAYGR